MRLSYNKLAKLRSGNTVWRVLFLVMRRGEFIPYIEETVVLGKRVLHRFSDGYSSMKMECKRPEMPYYSWEGSGKPATRAHYLADLAGDGCFTSRRQAQRFVDEVMDGRHPEVSERILVRDEMDRLFDSMLPDSYNDLADQF